MRVAFITTAMLSCVAGGAVGCGKDGFDSSVLRDTPWSEKTPGADEQVGMMYSGKTADERREGIGLVAGHQWGLKEPYLRKYAEMLKGDLDASVRGAAALALGRSGQAKYLPDVVSAISDSSDQVRWDAAAALDGLVGPAAVDPLRKHAVEDSSAEVRACCAKALRHYRDKRVEQTLIECLMDESFAVCFQAHASLVELRGCDLGYEPGAWLSAAAGKPATLPPEQQSRPWWDWLGVTQKGARQGETEE